MFIALVSWQKNARASLTDYAGGIVSELQLLALLSKQNTDVIYKPDEKDTSDWRGIIRT